MTDTRKLRVFLCHSSQDKPIVREIYQRLSSEGWIDPWLDEEKLLPGQNWDMEIEKAVEAADVVIVCISSNSASKEGYIQRELKFVLDIALEKPEGTIFIVPLKLDDCELPRRLRSWQYVNYFPTDQRKWAYQRLLQSLKLRFDQSSGGADIEQTSQVSGQLNADSKKPIHEEVSDLPQPTIDKKYYIDLVGFSLLFVYFVLDALVYFGDSNEFLLYSKIILTIVLGVFFVIRKQLPTPFLFKVTVLIYMFLYSTILYMAQIGNEISIGWLLLGVSSLLAGGSLIGLIQAPKKLTPYSSIFFAIFLFLVGVQLGLETFDFHVSQIFIAQFVVSIVASILMWKDL